MITDSLGRTVSYLRLSITPACAMRCCYCRPELTESEPASATLIADEIVFLVRHMVVRHGVRKVRLTGGEPTARPDLAEIVRRLAAIEGLQELAMTTGGLSLAHQAAELAEAGLQRVNISLDSLSPHNFARITGSQGLGRVLAGIDAAQAAGLTPIKLNTVVLRGLNDHELPALVRFAAERDLEIRFIELMPMGPLADRWAERFVPENVMRERLAETVVSWELLPTEADSAQRFSVRLDDGRPATIGFIAAMSEPFCSRCDRIRIASDGAFYPCLMGSTAGTLLPALRPVFDPAALDELLQAHLAQKAAEHSSAGVATMSHLGG
jgi:GTP 3',8-cyclase